MIQFLVQNFSTCSKGYVKSGRVDHQCLGFPPVYQWYHKLNKLVLTRSNLSVCQQCCILTQLIVIDYILLYWMLYFVWYKSIFLTVHSLSSLHVLNMFSSWILSYQYLHMIAFPGLIVSILFLYRITYSILAHFYLVYSSFTSLTQYFTYKLQASIFSYVLSMQYSVLR